MRLPTRTGLLKLDCQITIIFLVVVIWFRLLIMFIFHSVSRVFDLDRNLLLIPFKHILGTLTALSSLRALHHGRVLYTWYLLSDIILVIRSHSRRCLDVMNISHFDDSYFWLLSISLNLAVLASALFSSLGARLNFIKLIMFGFSIMPRVV